MNGRAPSDLVSQLRLLVAEEALLAELMQQVTDYYDSGRTVVHGPWRAADCQQILLRWFNRGLIDCVAVSWATKVRSDEIVRYEYDAEWRTRATEVGRHLVLAHDDAGLLLSDPSTWRVDGTGAGVMVCASDEADGLSFDAWFDALAGLPDDLIFERPRDAVSGGQAREASAEPEEVRMSRLWTSAVEHAATDGLPVPCPVNGDAYLAFDRETTDGETASSRSIDDIVCFVDRDATEQGPPFPFGRHRLWCPGCGAEQYLVVTRRPS